MSYTPGNGKLNCPHCDKEIKAKKINKKYEQSNPDEILDICGECGRFIRKSHLTQLAPETKSTDWVEDTCWFCEARPAEADQRAVVFLKKDESSTSSGLMTQYKAKVTEVLVPRCSRCKKIQRWTNIMPWITSPLALGLFIGGMFFFVRLFDASVGGEQGAIAFGMFIILLAFLILAPLYILKAMFPDLNSTKGIGRKADHPQVKVLKNEGWNPQYDSQIG